MDRYVELQASDHWTKDFPKYRTLLDEAVEVFCGMAFARATKPTGLKVMDVGCGDGYSTAVLKAMGWDATGVDLSVDKVRYAQEERGVRAVACVLGREPLPFADGEFDAIFSSHVAEHFDELDSALEDCVRVLRVGGFGLFIVPFGPSNSPQHMRSFLYGEELPGGLRRAGFAVNRVWNVTRLQPEQWVEVEKTPEEPE